MVAVQLHRAQRFILFSFFNETCWVIATSEYCLRNAVPPESFERLTSLSTCPPLYLVDVCGGFAIVRAQKLYF